MKMKEQASYPKTDASLKKGGMKDKVAYGSSGGASLGKSKGAKLDKEGGTSKKGDSLYKEHCKDQ
jgi:hypothetical protein